MSDFLKHECGVAAIRLLKPLSYFQDKYGSTLWAFNKLLILMEKQYNRGQDGAGIGCVKLNMPLGQPYLFRTRDASKDALGAELGKELPGELGVNADGNVIGKDGQVKLLVQDAEVLLDLGHAAQGVERSSGDQDVGAELLRDATVLEHALGLGIDDADQNRHAVVDDADGLGDDLATTLVGGENDLTRRAQEEQAIDAGIDHAVDNIVAGTADANHLDFNNALL